MELSNAFRRPFAFCVLALFLLFALAPAAVVIAGPGDDPVPVPCNPLSGLCSTGGNTVEMSTILALVIDVVTAVVI